MQKLTRDNLISLEKYAEERPAFRQKVIAHKRNRRLDLGTNAALYFEDFLTMQYQVQEMLRIERIFEADGINEELNAYNPLDSRWFELESDIHDRIPRSRRASCDVVATSGHRKPGLCTGCRF